MQEAKQEKAEEESLLARRPTDDYLEDWKRTLMVEPSFHETENKASVVVFRLAREWLALKTICFKEVAYRKNVHRIPHRNPKILLGVVNIEGVLRLCVALHELLNIEYSISKSSKGFRTERMISIAQNKEFWVFPVDEVQGIHVWDLELLQNVPINISKSTANYLSGVMLIDQRSIGLLNEELIFYSLKRAIQ